MCHEFCEELRGWCKSFTSTEKWLTLLETFLLVVFLLLFVFLFLHFLFCPASTNTAEPKHPTTKHSTSDGSTTTEGTSTTSKITSSTKSKSVPTRLPPNVKCTWIPSHKTSPVTQYFEGQPGDSGDNHTQVDFTATTTSSLQPSSGIFEDVVEYSDFSEGEEIEDSLKNGVVALVKILPSREISFGCTCSVLSEHWIVTAASCLEDIEEVDSLDSFVLMENFGEEHGGTTHVVSDVVVHPLYGGINASYDIVAMKSQDSLLKNGIVPLQIASLVDLYTTTIGESLQILGFGTFRSSSNEELSSSRSARAARVWVLGAGACGVGGGRDGWGLRHLWGGRAAAARRRAWCGGVRHARGAPCRYCAGSPLVRGGALLGLMARRALCGAACEPALYVSAPHLAPWLDAIIHHQSGTTPI